MRHGVLTVQIGEDKHTLDADCTEELAHDAQIQLAELHRLFSAAMNAATRRYAGGQDVFGLMVEDISITDVVEDAFISAFILASTAEQRRTLEPSFEQGYFFVATASHQ